MPTTAAPARLTLAHRIGGWAAFLCAVHCLLWPTLVIALAVGGLAELPYVDVIMAGVSLVALVVIVPRESGGVRLAFAGLWLALAVGVGAETAELEWGGPLTIGASLALALLHLRMVQVRRQRARV